MVRKLTLASLVVLVVLMAGMVATRIGFGTGYQVEPPASPAPGTVNLTAAPAGGWNQISEAKAFYYNGKTYFGWIDGGNGGVYIAAYTHATETVSTPFLLGTSGADLHNNPAILVRESDKRIVVMWSGHSTGAMNMRISTNPEDATAFAAKVNLDGQLTGGRYTYPILYQLKGILNDPIYLFWRDMTSVISSTGRLAYSISTDGGTTWSVKQPLLTGAPDRIPYWRITSDWDTRLDIFSIDRTHSSSTGLWHMYIDGTDNSVHQSDGTEIVATKPFQVGSMTQVISGGPLFCMGASWDGTAPATLVMQQVGSTDNKVSTARWRSGAWQVDEVVPSVGGRIPGNIYFSNASMVHTDPDIVYLSKKIGAKFEVFEYTTANDGATWIGSQITSDSAVDNIASEVPHFRAAGFMAMWLRGTYVSDGDFSFGISALE